MLCAACSSPESTQPPPTEGVVFVHNEYGFIFARYEKIPRHAAKERAEWLITNYEQLCFTAYDEPLINPEGQKISLMGCARKK